MRVAFVPSFSFQCKYVFMCQTICQRGLLLLCRWQHHNNKTEKREKFVGVGWTREVFACNSQAGDTEGNIVETIISGLKALKYFQIFSRLHFTASTFNQRWNIVIEMRLVFNISKCLQSCAHLGLCESLVRINYRQVRNQRDLLYLKSDLGGMLWYSPGVLQPPKRWFMLKALVALKIEFMHCVRNYCFSTEASVGYTRDDEINHKKQEMNKRKQRENSTNLAFFSLLFSYKLNINNQNTKISDHISAVYLFVKYCEAFFLSCPFIPVSICSLQIMGGLFLYKVAKLVTIYPCWSINPFNLREKRENQRTRKVKRVEMPKRRWKILIN